MKYQENGQHLSKRDQMLAASALIPVLGALSYPTTLQALIYSLFVCAYLAPQLTRGMRKRGREKGLAPGEIAGPEKAITDEEKHGPAATVNFFMVLLGAGLVSECLAWVSELFATNPNPGLLHPQLFADLFLGLFYYLGLALAWLILIKPLHFRFSLREIFLLSFLASLLTQAKLDTLKTLCEKLVSDPIAGVMTVASLLVVGGSITSLAFLAGHKASPQEKKPQMVKLLIKYTVSLILIVLLPELLAYGAGLAGKSIGICPDKKPIWEAPLI